MGNKVNYINLKSKKLNIFMEFPKWQSMEARIAKCKQQTAGWNLETKLITVKQNAVLKP